MVQFEVANAGGRATRMLIRPESLGGRSTIRPGESLGAGRQVGAIAEEPHA